MFDSIEEAIKFAKDKDDGGIPLFKHDSVENKATGEFEDVVWVTIINKGDPKSIIERPKRPEDEKRWPNHWKAFVEGEEAPLEGIPLKEFPMMRPADIANCHRYHIRTVEDLAAYPDGQLRNLGGRGVSLKKEAVKYLEYRQGPDIDALTSRIAELEKKLGDTKGNGTKRATGDGVSKSVNAGGKQQPRRKGRPPGSKNKRKKAS